MKESFFTSPREKPFVLLALLYIFTTFLYAPKNNFWHFDGKKTFVFYSLEITWICKCHSFVNEFCVTVLYRSLTCHKNTYGINLQITNHSLWSWLHHHRRQTLCFDCKKTFLWLVCDLWTLCDVKENSCDVETFIFIDGENSRHLSEEFKDLIYSISHQSWPWEYFNDTLLSKSPSKDWTTLFTQHRDDISFSLWWYSVHSTKEDGK